MRERCGLVCDMESDQCDPRLHALRRPRIKLPRGHVVEAAAFFALLELPPRGLQFDRAVLSRRTGVERDRVGDVCGDEPLLVADGLVFVLSDANLVAGIVPVLIEQRTNKRFIKATYLR